MILYKYYSPTTNSFKSLINAGLWCDSYTNMNDPFECLALISRSYKKEDIELFKTKAQANAEEQYRQLAALGDDIIVEFMNTFRRDFIKQHYFFASLSETYDNVLLWSHYAASHTGFVLAIDIDESDNHIQKVIYQNNLPNFDIDWYFSLNEDDDSSSEKVSILLKDLAIKSENWLYEREWRACRKDRGYFRFLPEKVKAIYYGLNCHVDIEKVIVTLLSYADSDIPVYKMGLSINPLSIVAKDYEFPQQ
jgi:hypothetical protein